MEFIYEHRRKFFVFFIILFIVSAAVTGTRIYNPVFFNKITGFAVVPAQKAIYSTREKIGSFFAKRRSIEELTAENEELKRQISALTDENKRLSISESEIKELSKLLDINLKYPDYEKMGVQIISADTSNWHGVFTIDRGSDDGIQEDMFVVAEGGLAGRIFEVSGNYSKLMTIIDDQSAVYGQSRQTEDRGVIKGDSYLMQTGLCIMEHIASDAEISVGDEIITSVFSEIPAGISIGYVNDILPSADGLTRSAIITPGVDFRALNKAVVLLRKKDG